MRFCIWLCKEVSRLTCPQKIPVHGTKYAAAGRRAKGQNPRHTKDAGDGSLPEEQKGAEGASLVDSTVLTGHRQMRIPSRLPSS
jgi:hypothetical protein